MTIQMPPLGGEYNGALITIPVDTAEDAKRATKHLLEREAKELRKALDEKFPQKAIEEKEQTEAEYLKDAPYVAQEFYKNADEKTQEWMKDNVEYKGEDIIFTVKVNGKMKEYTFAKDNIKLDDVGNGQSEKVKNERVEVGGRKIDECYIQWNYMYDNYLKKGKKENQCIETDLGYIPEDSVYRELIQAMPSEDKSGWSVSGRQLFAMLGGELTGYRLGGSPSSIDKNGYFLSASPSNDNNVWGLKSDATKGRVDRYDRDYLRPVRALRTPPREL